MREKGGKEMSVLTYNHIGLLGASVGSAHLKKTRLSGVTDPISLAGNLRRKYQKDYLGNGRVQGLPESVYGRWYNDEHGWILAN